MKNLRVGFCYGIVVGALEGSWRLLSSRYMGLSAALIYLFYSMLLAALLFAVVGAVFTGVRSLVFMLFDRKRRGETGHVLAFLTGAGLFVYSMVFWHLSLHPRESVLSPAGLVSTGLAALIAGLVMLAGFMLSARIGKIRRTVLLRVMGGLVLACVLAVTASDFYKLWQLRPYEKAEKGSCPNVLVIVVDTLRADRLGCYGYQAGVSTNIDMLARSGCLFERAVCQIPRTNPSHCSIFTGLYPYQHGSRRNGQPLKSGITTLAQILRRRGYETAAFVSNWCLVSRVSGLQRGFKTYSDLMAGNSFFPLSMLLETTPLRLFRRVPLFRQTFLVQRPADIITADARDWLAGNHDKPFFLWVHYIDPHLPYAPPPPYSEQCREELRSGLDLGAKPVLESLISGKIDVTPDIVHDLNVLYDGEIRFVDAQIGKLLDDLSKYRLLENTLVVLTSDHGEAIFDYENYLGHGKYLYDPETRVPFMIAWEGVIEPGSTQTQQIRTIDYISTILDLVDVSADIPPQSLSFAPVISLKSGNMDTEESFAESGPEHPEELGEKIYSVCDGKWKLIMYPSSGRQEAYDLTADPGEKTNVFAAARSELKSFEFSLMDFIKDANLGGGAGRAGLSADDQERLRSLGYAR